MSLRQAAQQALDALDTFRAIGKNWEEPDEKAFQALRAALAEADEPVAWMKIEDPWGGNEAHFSRDEQVGWTALYTHPPHRAPLTKSEVRRLYQGAWTPSNEADEVMAFARAVERAHGIVEAP
jgi:hypothetical protein